MQKLMQHLIQQPKSNRRQDMSEAMRASLQNARGMTLVEVLIVLTIMASIMGVVGFVAVNALDKAAIKEAEIQLGKLDQQIQQYQIMNSRKLPENLDDLVKQKFTTAVPKDGWNQEFIYRKINEKEYELFSKGPDEQEGTEDDIKSPRTATIKPHAAP